MAVELRCEHDSNNYLNANNLEDSWVHIDSPSRSSSCSSVTSCTDKPADFNSSEASTQEVGYDDFGSNLDSEKLRLVRQLLPTFNGKISLDDVDWDSRCEAVPPRNYPYNRLLDEQLLSPVGRDGDTLIVNHKFYHDWSVRHWKCIRHSWFSVEMLLTFLASNLLSFIVGGIVARRYCFAIC